MAYKHLEIEKKWQDRWQKEQCFLAEDHSKKPKYFALDMFPYPSGKGLHVGHLASYTPTDIVARYKRAQGFNVLHPIGYDAFGLPAEQYAIQTGVHPEETTKKAIESFRTTLQTFGYSFDWTREISTCDPDFYKWTQFIFMKLFERGLAYQKEVPVNWCPELKTVLANEEVVDGKSERGGHPVVRLPMKQWMLKITDYAERLLADLDTIDWPDRTKEGQRHWIGKSVGAKVSFKVKDSSFEVFTTRPDTLFGATFMVLAPEHPLVKTITTNTEAVNSYVDQASRKSELDRKSNTEKTGVFTGAYAINPINNKEVPVWVADYVLMGYGTGAIMSVPAHDERDFEFAKKFDLPIERVVGTDQDLPFTGDDKLTNSDFLNGLDKNAAINKMIEHLEENNIGTKEVQYKLRDWLFSRQRYWGEPFPIITATDGTLKAVPQNELPVLLPQVADYTPSEKGEPPLARSEEFYNYDADHKRITDTMPGSAGSSWYFLRYTDPKNSEELCNFEKQKYWMPVDLYVGGAEHTVGHLLYARFWQKVLFDAGIVSNEEPFQKLAHQGTVLGPDGQKMSKSKGNVVNPEEVRQEFGADAARIYISFLGPFEKDKPWDTKGIDGVRRFLDRIWRMVSDEEDKAVFEDTAFENLPESLQKTLHKTIKKVGEDIESLSFNTAISSMMILVNELYKHNAKPACVLKPLTKMLQPFAPHVAEELWEKLGETTLLATTPWPIYEDKFLVDSEITLGVQVMGKMRGTITIAPDATEELALKMAKEVVAVKNAIEGKNLARVIYKPGKILNLIAK